MTAVVELINNKHIHHSFHCESHVFFLLEILECHMYGGGDERRGVLTGFWWGNLKERDRLETMV